MSIVSALFDNKIYSFEQAFGVRDITSDDMRRAIRDWYGLYYAREPTGQEDPCQRLPVAVVSKLSRTVFSEYAAKPAQETNKTIARTLAAVEQVRGRAVQQALIGGECFLKPVITSAGIYFSVVSRRNFVPLGRDARGQITDLGTAERTEAGGWIYTLLERRTVDASGYLTIESRLYRSDSNASLGTEVPLSALPQYAALARINRLPEPLWSVGLIPIRTPMENCVDGSPDGVAVYAAAAGLIHNINVNEAQLNGEFERGESRIIVGTDLMAMDEDGKRRRLKDHVFTAVDEDPGDLGVTIFSPALREASFLARKTEYLRNIETLIGFKRGILSEVEAAERTATEVTSSAGDYNLTIQDFQQMWERTLRETVRVCAALEKMYRLSDGRADPERDVVIDWGNGILYDEDKTWADYMQMVGAGMIKPEIALAWKFNLPWETPADLEKIRETYMPELETLLGGE